MTDEKTAERSPGRPSRGRGLGPCGGGGRWGRGGRGAGRGFAHRWGRRASAEDLTFDREDLEQEEAASERELRAVRRRLDELRGGDAS